MRINVDEGKLKEIVRKEQEIIQNQKKVVEIKKRINEKEMPQLMKRLTKEQVIELRKDWNKVVEQCKENPSQLENEWKKLTYKYQG